MLMQNCWHSAPKPRKQFRSCLKEKNSQTSHCCEKMMFGWRRGPKGEGTWLLHTDLLGSTWWAKLDLQASKGMDLLFSLGMFDYIMGQGILPQTDENPHFSPTGSSSQSFPALGWLLFLHWDLLCEDASPLLSFYVLLINFGPQLFQLSFNISMPIILNLVSYLYLLRFYLIYFIASLPSFF